MHRPRRNSGKRNSETVFYNLGGECVSKWRKHRFKLNVFRTFESFPRVWNAFVESQILERFDS